MEAKAERGSRKKRGKNAKKARKEKNNDRITEEKQMRTITMRNTEQGYKIIRINKGSKQENKKKGNGEMRSSHNHKNNKQ